MTGISGKENRLFKEWAKKHDEFSPDGVINEKSYLASNPKLLFLLKEVNSVDGFDLRQVVRKGGRSQTWDNMARWIYTIRNIDREIHWAELEKINTAKIKRELFKSICVMNIKKSPGGHTTNNNELWKIAAEDEEFLNRQFHIYYDDPLSRPDITIACGTATSHTFNELVKMENASEWKITSRGIYFYTYGTNNLFIRYAHPEARIQDSLLCYGLIDTIKELTRKKK
jgi:hypothetical protein